MKEVLGYACVHMAECFTQKSIVQRFKELEQQNKKRDVLCMNCKEIIYEKENV